MSESANFDPGPWRGHDFSSAYKHYDRHVERGYADVPVTKSKGKDSGDSSSESSSGSHRTRAVDGLLEPSIKFNCTNPLLIDCDGTGSMGGWPKTIFSKLPLLDIEGKEYLGKDMEIAFGAVGDPYHDRNPLQVRKPDSGPALKDRLLELHIEGGGGPWGEEGYELAALYALYKVEMPNAIKPIMILIGDEVPYDTISPEVALRVAGVTIKKSLTTKAVFEELRKKFAVYFIRKPHGESGENSLDGVDRQIIRKWSELVGEDHICELSAPSRVVDVILGILAKETGRIEYFKGELEGRQTPEQVKTVYKSLASIHKLPGKGKTASSAGHSLLKLDDDTKGGVSRRLLPK